MQRWHIPVLFGDRHFLDAVAVVVPAQHFGILLHDQRAQVLRVEHHDVGHAGRRVVVDERADQDAEGETQVVGQDGRGGLLLVRTLRRVSVG